MFDENISNADASIANELTEEQLRTVNGGLVVTSIIGILVGLMLPSSLRSSD